MVVEGEIYEKQAEVSRVPIFHKAGDEIFARVPRQKATVENEGKVT